jgi:hypothetical protein
LRPVTKPHWDGALVAPVRAASLLLGKGILLGVGVGAGGNYLTARLRSSCCLPARLFTYNVSSARFINSSGVSPGM